MKYIYNLFKTSSKTVLTQKWNECVHIVKQSWLKKSLR